MNELHSADFQKIYEEQKDLLNIIDVRTPMEFNGGHIPGVLHIDIMSPDFTDEIAKLDKEKHYYVICRSGNRSATACNYMESIGFKSTTNIAGGMMDWMGEVE